MGDGLLVTVVLAVTAICIGATWKDKVLLRSTIALFGLAALVISALFFVSKA